MALMGRLQKSVMPAAQNLMGLAAARSMNGASA
jgi:hypothetical protein